MAVRNIARALGDEISEQQPLLDSRLPDGSRVAAVIPPCSMGGTTLTIRKFHSRQFTAEELVRIGSLTVGALGHLRQAIADRQNILISGGTGSDKTTLLKALAASIATRNGSSLLKIPLKSNSTNRTSFGSKPGANSPAFLLSRSVNWSEPPFAIAQTAFFWAKFAAARHSIFFRHSTPATPERYRRFTRIRLNRPSLV